jgi:hypothetical protein
MARGPDGATARMRWLAFRLTDDGLAAIDAARGEMTRSAFVRAAVAAEVHRLDPVSADALPASPAPTPARPPLPPAVAAPLQPASVLPRCTHRKPCQYGCDG